MKKVIKLIVAILICEAAGMIGSIFTMPNISTWYAYLQKPVFSPPNWIFGPVWLTLYVMMGISIFLIIDKGIKNREVIDTVFVFTLQLLFNTMWSVVFFGLRSPLYGFVVIVILWLLILATIIKSYKISKPASCLLIPYFLWVSFASVLNFSVMMLNR